MIKFHPSQPQEPRVKIHTTPENIKRINEKIAERLGLEIDRVQNTNLSNFHNERGGEE